MEHKFVDLSKYKWEPCTWMKLDRTYESYRAMKLVVTFKPRSQHRKCSIVIMDRDMHMPDKSWYLREHKMYESLDGGNTWKTIWVDDVKDITDIVDSLIDKPDMKQVWMDTVVDQYKVYCRPSSEGKYELEVVLLK